MATVKKAKGFVSAQVKDMPKNVGFLQTMGDGAFLVLERFEIRERDRYASTGSKGRLKKVMKAGTLLLSTEGGHLYIFNGKDGFKGCGKNVYSGVNNIGSMLVQRVGLDIEVGDYKAPPAKKKKKVAKKVAKKKVTAKKKR